MIKEEDLRIGIVYKIPVRKESGGGMYYFTPRTNGTTVGAMYAVPNGLFSAAGSLSNRTNSAFDGMEYSLCDGEEAASFHDCKVKGENFTISSFSLPLIF